ncbi:MAG: hypothetical protein WC755_00105 [Candidatus Woesearchaeota archaeon]|jgi:hypothetical protein
MNTIVTKRLQIKESYLSWIRRIFDNNEKILEGAKLFKQYKHTQFTKKDLENLIFNLNKGADIDKILKRQYKQEALMYKNNENLDANYMALLRRDTDNYRGNLFAARKIWSKFVPSDFDWLHDITLPIHVNGDELRLLGYLFADAEIKTVKMLSGEKIPRKIRLVGNNNDLSIFEKYLSKIVLKLFNYNILDDEGKIPIKNFKNIVGKSGNFHTYSLPMVEINSKAITTWISYDIGIEIDKNQRKLPKSIITLAAKKNFLEGIIGHATYNASKKYLELRKKGDSYNTTIKDLFSEFEMNINLKNKGQVIYINTEYTKRIFETFELINPIHEKYASDSQKTT